jgi:hypothetical protein
MPEQFDQSFYVLCVVGIWILELDALSTEEGREQVKDAFRAALLSAGNLEDWQKIPEFRAAMRDMHPATSGNPEGVITVDESELSPIPAVDTEAN